RPRSLNRSLTAAYPWVGANGFRYSLNRPSGSTVDGINGWCRRHLDSWSDSVGSDHGFDDDHAYHFDLATDVDIGAAHADLTNDPVDVNVDLHLLDHAT